MGELGKVVDKKGNILKIELTPTSMCKTCGLCHSGSTSNFYLDAIDNCNAKVGDTVVIEIERKKYYKAIFLIYGLPLILFIIGVIFGYLFSPKIHFDPQLLGLILGFLLMAFGYILVRYLDHRLSKKQQYIIVAKKVV
jgi:sigma-E factor negative regulatory protein RseC